MQSLDLTIALTFLGIFSSILIFIWQVLNKLVIEPQQQTSIAFNTAIVELRNLIREVSTQASKLELTVVGALAEFKATKTGLQKDVTEIKERLDQTNKRVDFLSQLVGRKEVD